jgi:NifB/MoaA-like Fe-S oxidoreductase
MHFIHASDEWYILAGMDVPEAERYDGYIQYENGVGMVRLFRDELEAALKEYPVSNQSGKVTLVTAKLIYPTICWAVEQMQEKLPNMEFQVVCITNHFFGEQITVAGLLTAQDIYEQLKDRDLGDYVILPGTVLKADEDIFLDNWSLDDLQKALQVDIHIVKSNGMGFLEAVTKTDKRRERNE